MFKRSILIAFIFIFSAFIPNAEGQSIKVEVNQNVDTLGVFEIFELTFKYRGIFKDPWEYADIRAEFTNTTSKETYSVGGFYYQFDEWKVRFAPMKTGEWMFDYRFLVHGKLIDKGEGTFTANQSGHSGFVRISDENPFRFVFDDGTPYYMLGFGNCNHDNTFGFDGPDRWELEDDASFYLSHNKSVDMNSFFGIYSEVGFNIYRWSNNNCGFNIYKEIASSGNSYNVKESKLLDDLVTNLRQHGFRLIFNPLNTPDLTRPKDVTDSLKVDAVKRYLRYCINRWGAWTDIWELFNEEYVDSAWFAILVSYIKEIDPYQHSITSNPSHMAQDLFDLLTLHEYDGGDNTTIDKNLVNSRNKTLKKQLKPMVFTEYGNSRPYSNYHPLRYRVFIWTAFTHQAHLVFWNNSFAKYDTGGVSQYTNIYLGPEARQVTEIHTGFIDRFPIKHQNIDLKISYSGKVRAHTLQAEDDLIAYFYYFADRPNIKSGREKDNGPTLKNMTVKIPIPANANIAIWIDPKSGEILDSLQVNPGLQAMSVPDFRIDVALRVTRRERIRGLGGHSKDWSFN